MTFGNLLKKNRIKLGVTQSYLCKKLNVTQNYFSNVENNRTTTPSYEKVVEICDILKLDDTERLKMYVLAFEEKAKDGELEFIEKIDELRFKLLGKNNFENELGIKDIVTTPDRIEKIKSILDNLIDQDDIVLDSFLIIMNEIKKGL